MAKVNALVLVVTIMITFTSLPALTFPAEYVVGDESGWSYDIDLDAWSQGKTFYAGDILVFNYDPTQHNVYAVNADGYSSCSSSSNLGAYDSGSDRLTLPSSGTYYFICSYHCDYANQKMQVVAN